MRGSCKSGSHESFLSVWPVYVLSVSQVAAGKNEGDKPVLTFFEDSFSFYWYVHVCNSPSLVFVSLNLNGANVLHPCVLSSIKILGPIWLLPWMWCGFPWRGLNFDFYGMEKLCKFFLVYKHLPNVLFLVWDGKLKSAFHVFGLAKLLLILPQLYSIHKTKVLFFFFILNMCLGYYYIM